MSLYVLLGKDDVWYIVITVYVARYSTIRNGMNKYVALRMA